MNNVFIFNRKQLKTTKNDYVMSKKAKLPQTKLSKTVKMFQKLTKNLVKTDKNVIYTGILNFFFVELIYIIYII